MLVYIIIGKDKKNGRERIISSNVYTTMGKAMEAIESRYPNTRTNSMFSLEWITDTEVITIEAMGVD